MHLCHLYCFTHEIFITFLPAPLSYMVLFLLSGGPPAAGTAPLILQFSASQRHARRSLSGLQTLNEPVGLDWLSPCSFFFFSPVIKLCWLNFTDKEQRALLLLTYTQKERLLCF